MEMALKLVQKDFKHLTYSLKGVLISWCCICICLPLANLGTALVMPALGAYLIYYSMMSYEERNKGQNLIGALPINRSTICFGKYLEVFLYIIGGIICSQIGLKLKSFMDPVELSVVESSTLMLSVGLIYMGVILPISVRFGVRARYILIITYGGMIGAVTALDLSENIKIMKWLQSIASGMNGVSILFIGISLWIISYFISLRFFKHKNF